MGEIRQLHGTEIDDHLAISQFAFQFEIAERDMEESRANVKPEEVYGYFEDNQLAANLVLLPLEIYINGISMNMGGIAGVASWPEYRRGGRVAKLLQRALSEMKRHGQLVSMLAPFSFAFYRRYGWEHCIDRKKYTIQSADWPAFENTNGRIVRVQDFVPLVPLYEAFARRYTGTLKRSEDWWRRKMKRDAKSTVAMYYDAAGNPQGYLIYQVKNSELTVHEMVHLTEEARRGIWNFIRQHDSMATKATVVVPTDDVLPFLIRNPRIQQEIIPYFMGRIVDVEAFFRQFPFVAESPAHELAVHVTDPNAPWNEALFSTHIERSGGSVTVQRAGTVGAGSPHQSPSTGVSCDIQTLTAMMFGYQRPITLAAVGRLTGLPDAIDAWEQAIPNQVTFLYDAF